MDLHLEELFRAKWSDQIHEEWIAAVLVKRPDIKRQDLERRKEAMNKHADGALVSGYESLIPGLILPDERDKHVLAAAIVSGCSTIVTFNIKDFPRKNLGLYNIEAQHPDEFVEHLISLDQSKVLKAVKNARSRLKNPSVTPEQFLAKLEKSQLTTSVAIVRKYVALI